MGSEIGYIEGLRRKVGHDPLILACAGCAVLDDAGRVLMQQRGDVDGPWGLPGGAMELGETIEATAVRETFEETGLRVRPEGLLGVYTGTTHTYANGDVVQAVVVVLTATVVDGTLTVDGAETVGLGWFALDDLPGPVFAPHQGMLDDLRNGMRATWT
ncbi:NUDIX hydrolase [Oryzihumus leptocrescens]|uniref:ADP-ribose pyrophosphatase YjhB (NUDIX family) n=1 Tax=Oryzihumus leptocrescens TaxID=297536 RepID=A0A542ZGP5_9MICO|nr:NUDIX domain-containing protein [Oryzihumus leptocrescens]TQL59542.1 ADP-ribose pyrophosphatase YjhB (NUDIX family) [Oryzihumus leptocrescens]